MASYQVNVSGAARGKVRNLPGNMRQRIVRLLRELEATPRPSSSKPLDLSGLEVRLETGAEARRIRVEGWRVIYVIEDEAEQIFVLAIRKRPPYQYEDLAQLLDDLS
jgi:mRNA interferase RelE/StbE